MIKLLKVLLVGFLILGLCTSSMNVRESSPADADGLEKDLSVIQERLDRIQQKSQTLKSLGSQGNLGANKPDYECIGGVNPKYMTTKQYLEAFNKGPCTPAVVLAGIAETKLMIQIDCALLQKSHPDRFATCGWNSCTTGIFKKAPKEEYGIWMPDLISPFTLINPLTTKYQQCFSALFGFVIDQTTGVPRVSPPKGVSIIPVGMTESTRKSSNCGFDSITSILPLNYRLNPLKWRAFDALKTSLQDSGYILGLTLQALPYDWRKSMTENQVADKFKEILTSLKDFTGKKASIIAHSFGNLNTLYNIQRLTPQEREDLIQRYFAIAPPFLGAPTTAAMMLGGSSSYHFKGMGLNFDSFKKTLGSYPSAFDLMPKNTWKMSQEQDWMKSIMKRIAEETGEVFEKIDPESDIVDRLFPMKNQVCYANNWGSRDEKCTTGLTEFFDLGTVNKEKMTTENLGDIFAKYSFNEHAGAMFKQAHPESIDRMDNPLVQTNIIYSNILTTGGDFFYEGNPKDKSTKEGVDFIEPNTVRQDPGDGSVLTTSSLIPGIKWAREFELKPEATKPILFVEMCSTHNQRYSVYQKDASVTKNERIGIKCNCNSVTGESPCDHLGMISDSKLVEFINSSLRDNQVAETPKNANMTEAQLVEFVKECRMLNRITPVTN